MPRDARAYRPDIIESCHAIRLAVEGLDLAGYRASRLIRSSVEREFIIIGEAAAALAPVAPQRFDEITRARRTVDFGNRLTHETHSCGRSSSTMCRCSGVSVQR
jgi:uncharacterized protein with HEPN domain